MSSQNRRLFAAGGDSNSSPVNGSESDVVIQSDRAFLIGVAGGTASGKVIIILLITIHCELPCAAYQRDHYICILLLSMLFLMCLKICISSANLNT